MEVKDTLRDLNNQITNRFEKYLGQKESQAHHIHPQAPILIQEIKRFITGGNRARPAFLYYSYIACGGKEKGKILDLALSLELLHSWALIHDDIIDRSPLRRGKPATHTYLAEQFKKTGLTGDKDHYGLSMAILIGDLALTLADDVFESVSFPEKLKEEARILWEKVKFEVIHGEGLDVLFSFKEDATEKDIFTVLQYKTAQYTIQKPVEIGATLAGVNQRHLQSLGRYGLKLGQVFQLQDDILGVFGKEKEMGKSATSDLTEGKKTLLVLEALKSASSRQKEKLTKVLGNLNSSQAEIDKAKEVLIATGALAKTQAVAKKLSDEAISEIENLDLEKEGKEWLIEVAKFLEGRVR